MAVAMPGGAAVKVAHSYEHLWTVMRICELLDGPVRTIRLEPPGSAGSGIEFVVDVAGEMWGEQAKDTAGNWTIGKLTREGVLAAAKHQVGRGRSFRFVAASAAADFSTLADRSRSSESINEFREALRQRRTHLALVADTWAVSEEEAWHLLRGVDVEHIPFDALSRLVSTMLQRLLEDDPDLVLGALREFCDQHLHRRFAAPQVWAWLESKGLRRRHIVGDRNVIAALRRTLDRQRCRVRRAAPSIGFVPHNDVDHLLTKLRNPEGRQVIVVDGSAGVGKSRVVSSVATALESEDWYVAFARMDGNATTPTAARLGVEMGLTESPSILLQGVAGGMPALLVIDQLDAVSTYSGRMADNFEAVDEAVSEARGVGNVKVLLVVRSVDLEADPRLVSLLRDNEEDVERHTVDKLDVEDVKTHLGDQGIQVPASDATLELLRTAVHFAVYMRLSDRSRAEPYRTLQDLYAEYTDQIRKDVGREVGRLDWPAITATLVTHMSDKEVLTAPAHVLDPFDPLVVDALVSRSVLVRDQTGVAFFHESYFDYLFARAFVAGGRDLCGFLVESGQYLFRRAQTRQVLEYLVGTDPSRFSETIVGLLQTDRIRSHLKAVAIRVLRQVQPTSDMWQVLDPIAWSSSAVAPKLINLLSGSGWFDAADELGLWEVWLADPERVDDAFSQMVFAARERPERVAELVRPYVGSEGWSRRFCSLIGWSLSRELVDLTVALVGQGQLDDIRGPIVANSDIWSILRRLLDEDPAGTARIIGAILDRGLARAQRDGGTDPFESGHLANNSPSHNTIAQAGSKAPAAFLHHVLPFVLCLATISQHGPAGGWWPRGRRWGLRRRSTAHTVADAVFTGVEQALTCLAREDPDACATALKELRWAESYELRFLACRALTVIGNPDDAVQWLISDLRNLALGWADSSHWAARELVKECSPACSEDLFGELQSALLDYMPDWEERGFRGRGRYVLMSALDPARISPTGRRKLQELERRFEASPPAAPQRLEAQWVGSPIGEDASRHMSDDNWLQALRKHHRDRTTWDPTGPPVGGARELANQSLAPRAREHPERFALLAMRFDQEVPPDAMNEILRNVEDSIDVDLLTELCEHAHLTYGPAVGRSVCSAIRRAETVNPRLVTLICAYSQDINPEYEEARPRASNGQYQHGEDLFSAGSSSTRGEAALAAAKILFARDDYVDTLLPAVEALARDDILAVRVCAAYAVQALLNHTPEHALNLTEELLDKQLDVLDARTSETLLMHAVLRDPNRFTPFLAEALAGPDQIAKRAGRIWAVARQHGQLIESVVQHVQELPARARQGAAEVFAANIADSLDSLPDVFDDDDPDVRQQAAQAIRHIRQVTTASDLDALLGAFGSSKALPDNIDQLIYTLKDIPTILPARTVEICQQAIDVAGTDLGDITTAHFVIGPDLVDLVLRLYMQGNATLRARCLDIIDQLTDLNAYDLETKLDNQR